MKYSEAMLKGFEMVGGRQCTMAFAKDASGRRIYGPAPHPHSVCAHGAAMLALHGDANFDQWADTPATRAFHEAYGLRVVDANNGADWDDDPENAMPWEDIHGMCVAIGL